MLSQTVGYAILALGYLAENSEGPTLVKDISAATGIPSAYLAKIINTLARKGMVTTQRGIRGGVTLAHPPESVTVFDLCRLLDDPMCEQRCMMGLAECSDERACPAHEFWKKERAVCQQYLDKMTLADVGQFETEQRRKRAALKQQNSKSAANAALGVE
ncbi:MAG: Rrf2 family transcriptional regulator [Anaerolineae bacterium]|nr:Rrf2 family transcriptional regulator [Anaerolineae bacterium]